MNVFKICEGCTNQKDDPALECTPNDCKEYSQPTPKEMAEMTVAQAIEVLHNNQYQKHIGNGDYDYIHPLTDTEAKGIESLIEQQASICEQAVIITKCRNGEINDIPAHIKALNKMGELVKSYG